MRSLIDMLLAGYAAKGVVAGAVVGGIVLATRPRRVR